MKKLLLMLMVAICTITLTTSCGGDDDDDTEAVAKSQIVGVWRDIDTSDGNEDYYFNSDGTGYIHFDDIEVSGYERIDFRYALSGSKLTFSVMGQSVTTDIVFSPDGNTLEIFGFFDESSKALILSRIR